MSINEMESKVKELRELRRMAEELPAERRKLIMEALAKIGDMEDAAAILAINGLVKNGGKNG